MYSFAWKNNYSNEGNWHVTYIPKQYGALACFLYIERFLTETEVVAAIEKFQRYIDNHPNTVCECDKYEYLGEARTSECRFHRYEIDPLTGKSIATIAVGERRAVLGEKSHA